MWVNSVSAALGKLIGLEMCLAYLAYSVIGWTYVYQRTDGRTDGLGVGFPWNFDKLQLIQPQLFQYFL